MNKVVTVNLNGNAFQLEEGGYDALRAYLDSATNKLKGDPDRDEIISDIEQAIADKLRAVLGAYKNVVATKQLEAVLAEMGPVDPGATEEAAEAAKAGEAKSGFASGASASTNAGGASTSAKRLYRLREGAMICGVCNGIAAYFDCDPTIVRVIFVVLTLITVGVMVPAYIALVLVVPAADTPAQKSEAHGATSTAQEFIRRAKEGYYEGIKRFPDREARREWKRRFKREMRGWRHNLRWEMMAGAHAWREHWHQYWGEHPQVESWWAATLPLFSLVHACLALACIIALISLLTGGIVTAWLAPLGIPLWLGLILLLIAYKLVVWPIKAARHVFYFHGGCGVRPGPRIFVSIWDSFVWLAFVLVLGWLAYRHVPLVREAVQNIPLVWHDAVESVRSWWSR